MAEANKYTSVAGHFNGHGGVPVQCEVHLPMQHDQGFTGSHWTPPSDDNSLRIAQAATRVTINTTMMQHVPTLLAILMAIAMRWYYTARMARWMRFMAFIKATKRHHQASTHSNITNQTCQRWLFWTFHHKKELQLTCWPLITIGVWHIKLMRRT